MAGSNLEDTLGAQVLVGDIGQTDADILRSCLERFGREVLDELERARLDPLNTKTPAASLIPLVYSWIRGELVKQEFDAELRRLRAIYSPETEKTQPETDEEAPGVLESGGFHG